jgi:2-oxoisovalerate dehydrogenase E1 component
LLFKLHKIFFSANSDMPNTITAPNSTTVRIESDVLLKAYELMSYVSEMAEIYDKNRELCKYVHSTSRGHEAIQLAAAFLLKPFDYVYPYYRDESILLGIGMEPYDLMLQLLAKKDDPFSGGRHYYAHPSLRLPDKPKIPYQSSATGMQAIPATGAAHGLKYLEGQGLAQYDTPENTPIVVCSLGDGAITEGEVSEAFQMAALHQLPIIYLIQDNNWSISAYKDEFAAMNAPQFAKGFPGIEVVEVDGSDFLEAYQTLSVVYSTVRKERRPFLVHAPVPLLGHHTSGVRREWYRPQEELENAQKKDPYLVLRAELLEIGFPQTALDDVEQKARQKARDSFEKAKNAQEPGPEDLHTFYYAPTPITEEKGERTPAINNGEIVMVDAALHAMDDILKKHPEALLYGQDVGGRLGGVFREAATLTGKYGKNRVFNTPIQEAYIIGSTSGMSAVGCKPVVEVQFADYIWPGLNQLFTELSRSYYLSNGKWPIQSLIRVPIGAYGAGGPFHSSSVESILTNIRGIKVVYPSNAADMKGLFKAAFYDPNPVVILEHKGLYWSKVPGSKEARTIEPDENYIIPLGKARVAQEADPKEIKRGNSCVIITYGMGVYWAKNGSKNFLGQVEIIDLRTLEPLDWDMISRAVKEHGKVMILTEEPPLNSFAEAISGRIARHFFQLLDAPVALLGSEMTPAIPLNSTLEALTLPSPEKVAKELEKLLNY